VAAELFTTIGQVVTVRKLTESIRASCRHLNISGEDDMNRMYLRVVQSGLLEPQASGTFRFRHPTFQEYLAGAGLARMLTGPDGERRERARALLEEKSVLSRWLEPLALMAGALVTEHGAEGQHAAARWISGLSLRNVSPYGDPGFLALGQALHALRDVAGISDPELLQATNTSLTTWADALAEAARQGRRTLLERLLRLAPDVAAIIAVDGGQL
jgi:hypothetical protein